MSKINMINGYTPLAIASGNVINDTFVVDFDNLAPTATICEFSSTAGVESKMDYSDKPFEVDAPFGACLSVKASAACTDKLEIHGYDYLGQPVTEKLTLSGATAVNGVKCFKYIDEVTIPESTAAVTVTVSRNAVFGLPYRTTNVVFGTSNGVKFTDYELTVAYDNKATESSSDPRGFITLTAAKYTEAAHIRFICNTNPEVFTIDGEEVGGLFGIPHYAE